MLRLGVKSCFSPRLGSKVLRVKRQPIHESISLFNNMTNPWDKNFLTRLFYYLSFVMSRKTEANYPDVTRKVLRTEKVKQAIEKAARDELEEIKARGYEKVEEAKLLLALKEKHRTRAVSVIQRMKSCISSSLLRIAGWVLYKLLSKMLNTIQFHKGQMEMLRRVRETNNTPIIYLPMHRSHLDYILVSFVLYMNNIKPPLIAAGDNLLIPFFGNLMRGLGAFYIKRKMDPKAGKRDHVYRAVLHSYMAENLRNGESLEFFIEGGRSRTGKACLPKAGLMSVIVDSVLEGVVEDVQIVPVAISYEKLIEGNFVAEQLGKPKVQESFSLAAKAIWATLHSNFGNVRVDFCQPFSLKEYLHGAAANYQISNNIQYHEGPCIPNIPCAACASRVPSMRPAPSTASLYGLDIVVSEDKRETIQELSEHVVYDAFNNTPLMSTQLLSFLLLTKYRKGATHRQLVQSMNWLREEITKRKRDVGLTGESGDVVRYASNLLGRDLVTTEVIQMAWSSNRESEQNTIKKVVLFKPAVKLPYVLELQYYSNAVTSVFLMDSIVANAVFVALDTELESLTGTERSDRKITRDELLNSSLELCNLLKYDFIFAPPCTRLETVINDTIDNLITAGIIAPAKSNPTKTHYDALNVEFEDDLEDGYFGQRNSEELCLSLSEESLELLRFYRSVLSPFIESYWLASCSLLKLIRSPREEKLFTSEMLDGAKERLRQGLLCYQESIAADPLKNAVSLFISWKVIERQTVDSVSVLYLAPKYNNEKGLNEFILQIEKFKK